MNSFGTRRGRRWFLPMVLLISFGCSPSVEDPDVPIELIVANIVATDVTLVLGIIEAQKIGTEGAYSTWKTGATVLKSFKGKVRAGERIQYLRTMETGFAAPRVGSRHIVSFVQEGTRLVIPDVGYHFDYSPTLEQRLASEFASP